MNRILRATRASTFAISVAATGIGWVPAASAQDTGTRAITLDPITVLATKTDEKTTDSLAAVSAVRGDQIDQIMPNRISDVFSGLPSVWFQERADDPGASINIRGLQDFGRVAVLIDGARQNFQRSGHNADGLFYMEPELLAGADVVRGPVANIYGSGAIGGVVSMHTKDVDDVLKPGQRWGVLTHGEAGDNKAQGLGSAFGAVRVNPNVEAMLGATYRKNDNYRDGRGQEVLNSFNDVQTAIGKFTVRPADGHEVKLSGTTYETNFQNGTPNATNTATVYDSTVKNHITTARWKYSRPEDRLFNFDGSAYWTKTDTSQVKIRGTSSAAGALGSTRTFTIDTYGADLNNTSRFDTGPVRHAFTYGGDWFQDTVHVVDPTGTGDLFTPDGERTVNGGFAQLKSNFSSWLEVISALRYDSYKLSGGTVSSSGDRLSPKFTVGITPVQWLTLYGTYAEGYRAPAITEVFVAGQHPNFGPGSNFVFLPNGSLKAEIGKTKEVGINIRQDNLWVAGDGLRFKANIYRNDVEGFIEQTTVTAGATGANGVACPGTAPSCLQYQNISSARIDGVEFEGNYDMGKYFFGVAGSRTKGTNLSTNGPLLKIAPQKLALTFGARHFDGKLTTTVRVLSVDAKPQNDIPAGSTTPSTAAYTVVNVFAGYQINEDVMVEFGVDNLFDKYYERYLDVTTSGSSVLASPSPGLTAKVGVKVRFGDNFFKKG
jgi:hemoglobin/transferrin/lactoferrin receptor protein